MRAKLAFGILVIGAAICAAASGRLLLGRARVPGAARGGL
jgi:hypothetical protein